MCSTLHAQDKQAILKLMNDQQTAWNNGDIETFMQGYWKSDSLVFVGKATPLYGWQSTTAVGSFWSGILNARPNTDIILADTSFALIEDITKKPIPLNDYLNRNYINQLQSQDLSQDRRDDPCSQCAAASSSAHRTDTLMRQYGSASSAEGLKARRYRASAGRAFAALKW